MAKAKPVKAYRVVWGVGDTTGVMYVVADDEHSAIQVMRRTVQQKHVGCEPVVYDVSQSA